MFNNNLCSSILHGRDLINAVVSRWLDGKCQRLLATALKVQHCWTLKTTVGDCWRQSPTCAGDSRQLKYKRARDCRRLSPSRATVSDCRRLKYKPGLKLLKRPSLNTILKCMHTKSILYLGPITHLCMVGRSGQNSSKVTRIKCNVYES